MIGKSTASRLGVGMRWVSRSAQGIRRLSPGCRRLTGLWVVGICCSLASAAGAAPPSATWSGWSDRAAESEFREITSADVEARRQQLVRRIEELERYLSGGGSEKLNGWKRFLKWGQLSSLAQGASASDTTAAQEVVNQFYAGYPGLELPRFVAVRDALTSYASLVNGRAQQPFNDVFIQQREALEAVLQQYVDSPNASTRKAVLEQLTWFENLGQLQPLLADLRSAHAYPNMFVQASDRFVSQVVDRDVQQTQPVRDVILGTQVQGTSVMSGAVTSQLVPSPDRVQVQLVLRGTARTQSIGYQRPVHICSTSQTGIAACQLLQLSLEGTLAGAARANCTTRTTIHSITAPDRIGKRLIEKIAWKRATKQKPLAEAEASRKAAGRVERMMESETGELVGQANQRLGEELKRPLEQRALYPRTIHFETLAHMIRGRATQAHGDQWAAPTPPPPLLEDAELSLQVHESMVNNTAETAIGGFRLTDARAAEIVEELTGSIPEELRLAEDKDPWSITFAVNRPVQVSFHDGQIEISVEGRQFTRGDRVLNRPMRIVARYRLELTEEGVRLVRDGELDATFPGRENERLSVREVAFKTFMLNKFETVFKPEYVGEGLELPGRLGRLGRRQVHAAQATAGWLSLGWN